MFYLIVFFYVNICVLFCLFSFVIVTLTVYLQRDIFDHCIVTHVGFKLLACVKLKIVCPPTSCLENLWFL